MPLTLACAINVSEGQNPEAIDAIAAVSGGQLLDIHRDADHHRSVLTLAAPAPELLSSIHRLLRQAIVVLDLRGHHGQHPRFGVVDVVPFSPIGQSDLEWATEARDRLAVWAGEALGIPCFLYGPMRDGAIRSLPEVRRRAFATLRPDTGPDQPHPSAGAMAVGARVALVAYNLWVEGLSLPHTKAVAAAVRGPNLRTLGLAANGFTQVSCNLIDPHTLGPAQAYDIVAASLPTGAHIVRAELVGLLPASVFARTPSERCEQLGLSEDDVLERRLLDPSLRKRRS